MDSKNYEWYLKTDLTEFAGKWIVIADEKLVVSGNDAKIVYDEAKRKYPDKKLSIAKVPKPETLIIREPSN